MSGTPAVSVKYPSPADLTYKYCKENPSDSFRTFEMLGALDYIPEDYFSTHEYFDVGNLVNAAKTGKTILSGLVSFPAGICEVWTRFWSYLDDLSDWWNGRNVDMTDYEIFDLTRLFSAKVANTVSKGCDTMKVLDKFEVIDLSAEFMKVVSGVKFGFLAYFLGNNAFTGIMNFGDEEAWRSNIGCDSLPDEVFQSFKNAESSQIVNSSITCFINLLSLAALVVGFVVAAPILLALSCVGIVTHVATFVLKQNAEAERKAHLTVSLRS